MLQLWDPETGFCIRQVSAAAQGSMFTAMAVVPIAFQPLVALGTSDSQLQFLDVRSKNLVHKWKIVGLEPNGKYHIWYMYIIISHRNSKMYNM